MKDEFKVHKCLTFYCNNCPARGTCNSCGQEIVTPDFIFHGNLKPCKFTNCEEDASLHCTCTQMELCEIHMLKVHSKVPEQKRCTPVYLYQEKEETFCSCKEFYSSFYNKSTQEELCFSCFIKLEDKNDFMEKDSLSHEYFESRLELLRNSISTYYRLNKSREEKFKDEIEIYNNKTTDVLLKVTELVEESKLNNFMKLAQMKQANREAQILADKLGDAATVSMLMKIGQSHKNKQKIVHDRLASWVKEKVKRLNQPSLSKIFIDLRDQGTRCIVQETIEPPVTSNEVISEPGTSGLKIARTTKHQLEGSPQGIRPFNKLVIDMRIGPNVDRDERIHEQEDQVRPERDETDSIHTDDIFESEDDYDPCSPVMVFDNQQIGPLRKLDYQEQQEVHVRLTGIRCPLWLFFEIPELQEKRIEIINMLDDETLILTRAFDIKTGDFVIIQDKEQFGSKKKRAKIMRPGTSPNRWLVKLLDYGRAISVPASKIFSYPETFDYTDETCFHAALLDIRPRSRFVFVMNQPYNAVWFIKNQLLHPSGLAMVTRKYMSQDGRVWCHVKSKRNNVVYDWARELVKANLALAYIEAFIPSKDYCYLGHFYGKCRQDCPRVHDCPFCEQKHLLTSCFALVQETKAKEKQAIRLA
uniref:Uncharacterized protein n=2 Tax=Tetranychus urticae TaxID=32264 RepID=T1KS39_TETUR